MSLLGLNRPSIAPLLSCLDFCDKHTNTTGWLVRDTGLRTKASGLARDRRHPLGQPCENAQTEQGPVFYRVAKTSSFRRHLTGFGIGSSRRLSISLSASQHSLLVSACNRRHFNFIITSCQRPSFSWSWTFSIEKYFISSQFVHMSKLPAISLLPQYELPATTLVLPSTVVAILLHLFSTPNAFLIHPPVPKICSGCFWALAECRGS